MTKLSPASQAVKDAVLALYPDKATQDIGWPLDIPTIAATLRAAADQVVPKRDMPLFMDDFTYADWLALRDEVRDDLFAIAAELEAL
jgi:hypothetical protein